MSLTGQTNLNNPALPGGLVPHDVFTPGEDPAEFFALLEEHFRRYQPSTFTESELVSDVVIARWLLQRRERACAESVSDPARFGFFLRYKIRAERALKRALRLLHAHQKEALKEQKRQFAEAQQKHRIEEQLHRLEVLKARNAPFIPAQWQAVAPKQPQATAAPQPDRLLAVIKPNPSSRRNSR